MTLASSSRRWRIGVGAAALALIAVAGSSAMASTVTFTAPSFTVTESATAQTYTADVLISDTNTSDIISDFALDLFLQPTTVFNSASPGSTETNVAYGANTGFDFVTTSTTQAGAEPYLYNNSLPNNANNSNAINYSNGGYEGSYTSALPPDSSINEVYGADVYATSDAAQMTQTWALARLYITVAPNYTGTMYAVWNNNGINNDPNAPSYSLSSAQSTSLDPNLVGGVITVVPIPEPSSVVLMVLGAVGLFGVRRLRTRRG